MNPVDYCHCEHAYNLTARFEWEVCGVTHVLKVHRRETATVAVVALLTALLIGISGDWKPARAAVPEFTNMAHVYNFTPPSPPAQSTRRGSDHEFYTSIVPKRDYATGQLLDAAGNPL